LEFKKQNKEITNIVFVFIERKTNEIFDFLLFNLISS